MAKVRSHPIHKLILKAIGCEEGLRIMSGVKTIRPDIASQVDVPREPAGGAGQMEMIEIGGPDLVASRIALGTWAIGGWMWGGSDVRSALKTIQAAIDHGITLIDTAPVYGFGLSEEIVGRALAPNGRRRRMVIATKCGLEWRGGKVHRSASPSRIREEVEDSLKRLRTDYIDLYQLHWPDPTVPLEETAAAFAQLLREGKIRAAGVSNLTVEETEAFRQVVPIRTAQPPYNLFEREIDANVLPYAAQSDLVVLAYGALCRGLLSGRMNTATRFEGDDLRRVDPKFQAPRFQQYLNAVAGLDRFAKTRFGKSVLALAVRWILDRGPTIALWGARRPEQLSAIGTAMGWSLDSGDMQEIDRILERTITSRVGPEFMAPPTSPEAALA
jgi:aryl-alcohol dehydrogenase-like predicted oxidoreductase